MNSRLSKLIVTTVTFWSFITGAVFVTLTYIAILGSTSYEFGSGGIIKIHQQYPLCWFIDIFPFLLAVAFWIISKIIARRIAIIETQLIKQFKRSEEIEDFIQKIKNGDFSAAIELDQKDKLTKALIELRDSMIKNKEEEINRKKEDAQRNWIAEGLAKFSDILRQNSNSLEQLSYQIISNLGIYIDAIQGGFYMLDDNDPSDQHFELTAFYAYNRRKYANKRVEIREGLIGRSAFEKETIYMDVVPEDYVEVTSGLGDSNPRSILIVPLIVNDEVHGVIEFASFHTFEKYQIEFVEKVAESIASTISSVKINLRTATLLHESQEQAERLAQQEEEMRQNMEELQATQEEAAKQSEQFVSFTNSVNHTLIRAEYDTSGILLYANTRFLNKLEYSSNTEVEGHHISMFINEKDREWFNDIWEQLAHGGRHFEGYMKHVTKRGKDVWTMATYTCVRNSQGGVEKVLFLAIDTTEQKKQSLDYEGQIKALNMSSLKVEFAPNGRILDANQRYLAVMEYTIEQLKEKSVFDFIEENELGGFEETWNRVLAGIPYEGQVKRLSRTGKELWFHLVYVAVNDMYGDVSKIIAIANDITEQKKMEIKNRQQTEQLLIQEEKLRQNEHELSRKLDQTRLEVRQQFKEIEVMKSRFEKTLEGALDSILTINQKGIVEFFNKAAEELWGMPRKDIIGKNVKTLFPAEPTDDFAIRFIDPELEKIVGKRQEVKILKSTGEEVPVLILLSEAKIENQHTYTAFIQLIEVELF